jgi:sensitive to high expression protein 9
LVVFLTAIVLVEPWKRRKMAEGIERRMGRMMEQVEGRIGGLQEQVAAVAAAAVTAAPAALAVEDAEGLPTGAGDLPLAEEPVSAIIAPPKLSAFGGDRAPLVQTVLPELPLQLASLTPITHPSHDRDLAIATTLGVALGAMLVGAAHLIRTS